MQSNLNVLGDRKLINLCILGSHDSGMSLLDGGTLGANECNTKTQLEDIHAQLMHGARYFDIRPVISSGQFKTGHYSGLPDSFDIPRPVKWAAKLADISFPEPGDDLGANGQSISSIVQNINDFTAQNKELIILKLSHDLDTDTGRNYPHFSQEQWNNLFKEMSQINHLYINHDQNLKINDLTLESLIGNNQACVIIIVDPENTSTNLGDFEGRGFFTTSALEIYDDYSGTNDLDHMANDQLDKMETQKQHGSYFLLSWTLTQDTMQIIKCLVPKFRTSIIELAEGANACLEEKLMPKVTSSVFPNIIYMDNIGAGSLDTVLRVNEQLI